jgi:integrase
MIKGDVIKNPCIGAELPENKKVDYTKEITFFNEEEAEAICRESLFRYGNGKMMYRLGHAIIVLMYTGMRISELLGLKWEDIDFEKKEMTIFNSVVLVKDRSKNAKTVYKLLEQNSTKTRSGDRVIPLSKKALEALQEIKKINPNTKYVMSTASGKIMYHRGVDRMFRNIQTRCKFKTASGVHSLRHTFASMLFRKGVDVKIVSELLGHADVATTYNMYIHLIKEQKQEAVVLLDEL